jgi:hypothetical protein
MGELNDGADRQSRWPAVSPIFLYLWDCLKYSLFIVSRKAIFLPIALYDHQDL